MPRGRKPLPKTYEEQLNVIDAQIASHRQSIEELKNQRKAVVSRKEAADLEQLMSAVRASGKSPSEFLAALQH